jgi:protein-S-isoprenylcysteine O-methyltransferase Ste14
MSENDKDAAAVRFPPPFVYGIALVAGALLQWLVLPLPLPIGTGLRVGIGAIAALAGVALVASAFGLFRGIGQDPTPWSSTPEIVTEGIYRVTRNPMYVGMALLQFGIGIGLANGWIVAFVPLVLAVVYAIAVRHEEAYLERKFGEGYLVYKRTVRRWL